jgi:alanine dehydrogenase
VKVAVAKEIKVDEHRVALTPAGARELVSRGHQVLVQRGAGEGSAIPDRAYSAAGARLVHVDDVWTEAELVLKVKEPLPEEYECLCRGQILFTYLHLAANKELTEALISSGSTGIAYETVETPGGGLPLLAPMSEIAGRLVAQAGAYFLQRPLGGPGILLGGVAGVGPGKVLVIGGGIVGYNAAVVALGLGGSVTILERSIDRMRHLEEIFSGRVNLVMSSTMQIEESVRDADIVIGAVLSPGAKAPTLIQRQTLDEMKDGSIFCDVAIDQGGCAETSRPTTHTEPTYLVDGVTHYCVTNIPGAVPITSTLALTNATLPYVEAVAEYGLIDAASRNVALARGINVLAGNVTHEAVARAHDFDHVAFSDGCGSKTATTFALH